MSMRMRFAAVLLCLFLLGDALAAEAAGLSSQNAPSSGSPGKLVFSTFPSEGMGVLFSRILKEAYGRIGYEIEMARLPAERALITANQGEVDGEAARVKVIEKDYGNLIRVPTPLYTNRIVVFSWRPGIDSGQKWDGLYRYHLASVIGYKFIEKKTQFMNRKLVSTYESLFRLLDLRRVDAVVTEYLEALPSLSRFDLVGVRLLKPPYAYNPMYHYLHKRHADLVPKIDAALKAMKEEGRLESILHELQSEYLNGQDHLAIP